MDNLAMVLFVVGIIIGTMGLALQDEIYTIWKRTSFWFRQARALFLCAWYRDEMPVSYVWLVKKKILFRMLKDEHLDKVVREILLDNEVSGFLYGDTYYVMAYKLLGNGKEAIRSYMRGEGGGELTGSVDIEKYMK